MIKRPDALKLGDSESHLKLSYVKKVERNVVEPVWSINGTDELTLRLIRDINLSDMGELLSGNRFSQGFAYILANPLPSKDDIINQREAISEISQPENSAKLDDIIVSMYNFGLDKETINEYGRGTHDKLKFLQHYSTIVQKLAEFSSFKSKPFKEIGEYADQILKSDDYLFVPMTAERGLNHLKLTMEISEDPNGVHSQIRFLKTKYGPKIPTANILRHFGHRFKAGILFMARYKWAAGSAVRCLVEENTAQMADTLQLLPIFEFYKSLINYEDQIKNNDVSVYPEFSDVTDISNLEHPLKGLKPLKKQREWYEREEEEKTVEKPQSIPNNYQSNKSHSTLLITGANNGGKTYFSKAVGISQLLAQRGTKIVASDAKISLVDDVYTHFVASDDPIHGEGRYKFELRRMDEILERCTPRSLIIVDEPCGGTDPAMGQVQSSYFLEALSKTGAQVIFNTHYHVLAEMANILPQIRNIHPDTNFKDDKLIYTYKMLPGPAGTSYALEVARAMNLGKDSLLEKAERAKNR